MLQEILYRRNVISRPFGSKLGETEPTAQEKAQAILSMTVEQLLAQFPIEGADVSRWQGIIDWGKFEAQLYFAYIQSSYGASGIDSGFKINLAAAQRRNIAYGLYHYLKPGNDWRKTAQLFYSCWKDSGSQLPPAFDIEQNDGLDKNDLNNWMEKVLKGFQDLGGPEIKVAYSSANFINNYVMVTPTFDWVKNMVWWIANWTTAQSPLLPVVFNKFAKPLSWEWWQYSSKGDGPKYGMSSPALDLNRSYCKTLAEFNAKYKVNLVVRPYTPPPPPPPPVDSPIGRLWVHTPGGINVRSGPGTQYPITGSLAYQTIITPTQIDGGNAWVEFEPGKWACVTIDISGQHLRFMEKYNPVEEKGD